MKKFKFQRLTPSHLSHVSHVPENTGVENFAPSSHNFAHELKKEEQNATCENVRNTCDIANPYRINNVQNMRNMRRGTCANIQKISFPMNGQDLIEFKRLAEAGVQFDFSKENPAIPTWAQIVPLNTGKEGDPVPCYCCGGQSFWRKKDNNKWICSECHPPAINTLMVEWLQ